MPDQVNDKATSTNLETQAQVPALQDEAWKADSLATLKDIVKNSGPQSGHQNEIAVSRVADSRNGLFSPQQDKVFEDLHKALIETQKQMGEMRLQFSTTLYDNEQSRRSMLSNPYKVLTVGTGAAVFRTSPGLASLPLTGFAALQGYDDFKNLKESTSFQTRSKYTLGMVADTAVGAGALGFLSDSVPMKYKAPLLVGGLLVRAAVDFIPNKR